jgi:hypothetical protein
MLQLYPFQESPSTRLLTFTGSVVRINSNDLEFEFNISGATELVQLTPPTQNPSSLRARKDDLWKHTCFEAFFSEDRKDSSPYYEMNCATNGDWNAYILDSYRQGLRPAALSANLLDFQATTGKLHLKIRIRGEDLSRIKHLSLAAVIEFSDSSKSYFAPKHAGTVADFHLKESFTISL